MPSAVKPMVVWDVFRRQPDARRGLGLDDGADQLPALRQEGRPGRLPDRLSGFSSSQMRSRYGELTSVSSFLSTFTGRGAWQHGAQFDEPRHFDERQALAAEGADLRFVPTLLSRATTKP